ncbi:MAG: lipase family alpha/beta hydrolase, partial [Casimicrobium sp.]
MKTTQNRACPVPAWAFVLALLIGEIALWAALGRHGVARGWWSDVVGGTLVIVLPFVARLLILFGSYRLSRIKGIALSEAQTLRGFEWLRFFLVEYAHFCKQTFLHLPFPVFFRSAADRGNHSASGRVILLHHGYAHSGAVWSRTTSALEKLGYRVYTIDQPLYAPIDTMADRLATRIHDVMAKTSAQKITIVAHSMGGLVARAYLRKYGSARIDQLVTVGTPHHGTFHAYLAGGTNGKQMRPGNAWLAELNKAPVPVPFTSIYSLHDTIIAPQDSSEMDDAMNIVLTGIGHVA